MKCSGSQHSLCIFAIPSDGRGEGWWLNPSPSLLWFRICTCREEALPQDINSLLPSVEFSLVFVLPLKWFLNFFFPFALWIVDILETCGECWFVFWGKWNVWKPFILQQGCVLLHFSLRNYTSLFSLLGVFYFSRESRYCVPAWDLENHWVWARWRQRDS